MAQKTFSGLLVVLVIVSLSGVRGQAAVTLTVSPSRMVTHGSEINLTCTLDKNQLTGSTPVVWERQVGNIHTELGKDNWVSTLSFDTQGRYKLDRKDSYDGKKLSYILTIKNARFEDSSTIMCRVENTKREASLAIAICDKPEAYSCECMIEKGWLSPVCFEEPPDWRNDRASHNRTIVGLGVCLAIAVIFGIILAILVGRDCMAKMYERERRRAEKQRKLRQNGVVGRSSYDDAEVVHLDESGSATELQRQPRSNMYEEALPDSGHASTDGSTPTPEELSQYQGLQHGPRSSEDQGLRHVTQALTHTNHAYRPDDDGYSSVSGEAQHVQYTDAQAEHGGARPRTGTSMPQAAPRQRGRRSEPKMQGNPPPKYADVEQHEHEGEQYRTKEQETLRTPQKLDNYSPQQYSSPGGISSISYSERPNPSGEYPPRGAYTDVPREKRNPSGYADQRQGYTDPRRLDFHGGLSGSLPTGQGAQIDSSSTMI